MLRLEEIRSQLATYDPALLSVAGKRQASVAMVLREIEGQSEVLLIERAHREGDPWSGHMAFPGGRREPGDLGSRQVAERETEEEVGLSLENAPYLGRIDDLEGRPESQSRDLVISAHVYELHREFQPVLSGEVEQMFWVPLSYLHDRERFVEHPYSVAANYVLPGIVVGDPDRHIVWGLTYRFLEIFFHVVERPLPHRWDGF